MNYQRIYNEIIDFARLHHGLTKNKQQEFERHHIIPKSFGGSNDLENLVDLTPRQHFICHWLLTKICIGEHKAKMIYAFWRMSQKNGTTKHVPTSRQYEIARKLQSKILSESVQKRVENGTHHFLSGEIQRNTNKKMVENGTHPWTGENGKNLNLKRIEDETHPFAGTKGFELQQKRIDEGCHPWAGERGSQFQKQIWKNMDEVEYQRRCKKRSDDQKQLVLDDDHNFSGERGSIHSKKLNARRVLDGTHNFLGGLIRKQTWENYTEKEYNDFCNKISITTKKYFDSLTSEERSQRVSHNNKVRYARWRRDNNKPPKPDDWKYL